MSAIEIPGYKIIRTLGVGGQATVYLAIQLGFEREVALKVMSPALAADPTFGERFVREAKIVAKLSHNNIVTVYDVGESGNFYYLAMEYLPGRELKNRIAEGMKARECLTTISKLAMALHFAHEKGYIHRDVKSENILFNEDDEPVLTDFGIAKASNSSTQMTQVGKLIGTPEYMSPEQCRGKKIDGRTDLYSLGVILYEMLTRTVPFTGEDSVAVCIQQVTKQPPQLPARIKHFQWLLELLLAKDPDNRFQTGEELAIAITEFKKTGKKLDSINQPRVSPKPGARKASKTIVKNVDDELDDLDSLDDWHTERRLPPKNKPDSRVSTFVSIILLAMVAVGGYLTRDRWFDESYQWLMANLQDKAPVDLPLPKAGQSQNTGRQGVSAQGASGQGANELSVNDQGVNVQNADRQVVNKSSDVPVNSGKSPQILNNDEQVKNLTPKVAELLQEADGLVQFLPQNLDDIKQALKLIATVNTLEPGNKSGQSIYQNIMSIGLSEATTLAEKNRFTEAFEWIALVEFERPDHALLTVTRQNIQKLKDEYDAGVSERAMRQQQIVEFLANGDKALSEYRLSTPVQDNATYYYQQVIAIDANNELAHKGLQDVANVFVTLVENAIDENAYSKAKSYLAKFHNLSDNESMKVTLNKKISDGEQKHATALAERRRIAAIAEQKRRAEEARQDKLNDPLVQMKLQGSLDAAKSLEERQLLVEPDGNNAFQKYQSALQIDDRNEEAKLGIARIERIMISNLNHSITAATKATAIEWLNKLRKIAPDHNELPMFQQEVDNIEAGSIESRSLEGGSLESRSPEISSPDINQKQTLEEQDASNAGDLQINTQNNLQEALEIATDGGTANEPENQQDSELKEDKPLF